MPVQRSGVDWAMAAEQTKQIKKKLRITPWYGKDPTEVRECGCRGHLVPMNYGQAIRELQDTLLVISEIERRQSALLREHSELLHQKHTAYFAESIE
jgi:hypothetical protein